MRSMLVDKHLDDVTQAAGFRYEVTGQVAHRRIAPLLPDPWTDVNAVEASPGDEKQLPDFIWENAPRRDTRSYRDFVKCYSHLPNGTAILDNKWVLARLLGSGESSDDGKLVTLESHCFHGISGFNSFLDKIACTNPPKRVVPSHHFDLLDPKPDPLAGTEVQEDYPGLWVVKDAHSNGAGGIWVVGSENYGKFSREATSPLTEEHRYVAQRYTWPMVLYGNRKCHVRVYGLLTSDARAFVHRRAFLHVANDKFIAVPDGTRSDEAYQTSVHITNCCANSHDPSKFAGEIVADLEPDGGPFTDDESGETVVPLGKFWESIAASVAELARRTRPFLRGGEANNGFECLGMDFILSYSEGKPVAYLLEVNAPPSQDTATGLPYAEALHDSVMRDLLTLWVYPKVKGFDDEVQGGWRCVHSEENKEQQKEGMLISPSKAVILNKILYAFYEKRIARQELSQLAVSPPIGETADLISSYARSYFPYYDERGRQKSKQQPEAFFENGGGSQVPCQVIDAVCSSLRRRNRSVIGSESKAAAKDVLRTILGAEQYEVFLGSNASSLLSALASQYVKSGYLKASTEIVISTDNHLANVNPWVQAANDVGAVVKWWSSATVPIEDVLSLNTRLVLVPHASNILGQLMDLARIRKAVDQMTTGAAHMIVDGVASVPHKFAAVSELDVDWYVVSCHKLFGPHLGALCGRASAMENIRCDGASFTDLLEIGTVSYEACAGVRGLGDYFVQLSMFSTRDKRNLQFLQKTKGGHRQPSHQSSGEGGTMASSYDGIDHADQTAYVLTMDHVKEAYKLIGVSEEPLAMLLLDQLSRSKKVRVIENKGIGLAFKLPVVSFVHTDLPSKIIVEKCNQAGVICRRGTFLCTDLLQKEYRFEETDGVVRFSLAHYNTISEVHYALRLLESLPGWY